MRRILLRVAYDGTSYAGFQAQKSGVPTIEGELGRAIGELTGESPELIGGSRTDAGVHALCNVAVFDTDSRIPAEKFAKALNTRLPEDICVQSSCETAQDFHPRHCDTVKTYEYRIYNAAAPLPTKRLYELYSYTPFDVEAMAEAAGALLGEHDFKSFCSVYSQSKTTLRTITGISVTQTSVAMPREIVIRVSGTGFLYNMVRIIAGTLMEVGRGAIPEKYRDCPKEWIKSVLEALDRRAAGPTAPAQGLCLVEYKFVDTDAPGRV